MRERRRLIQILNRLGRTITVEDPPDDPIPPISEAVARLHYLMCSARMEATAELQPADVERVLQEVGPAGVNSWINHGEWAGATPLWLAARKGCLAMVKLLCKGGADVNMRCHSTFAAMRRECALHTAARFNHFDILQCLVAMPGARLHRFKDDGATPIFLAIQEGHIEATRVLLAAGADPNFLRFDGTPPLLMASQANRWQLLQHILSPECHLSRTAPAVPLVTEGPEEAQNKRLTPEQARYCDCAF